MTAGTRRPGSVHMGLMKSLSIALILLSATLLTGCKLERATPPAAPEVTSSTAEDESSNVGGVTTYVSTNGNLRTGIDMGGGVVMTPSGGLTIGLGL